MWQHFRGRPSIYQPVTVGTPGISRIAFLCTACCNIAAYRSMYVIVRILRRFISVLKLFTTYFAIGIPGIALCQTGAFYHAPKLAHMMIRSRRDRFPGSQKFPAGCAILISCIAVLPAGCSPAVSKFDERMLTGSIAPDSVEMYSLPCLRQILWKQLLVGIDNVLCRIFRIPAKEGMSLPYKCVFGKSPLLSGRNIKRIHRS